ncbi:mechanosensitive ion channel family protein, partial [Candidatus Bathyarchaeota archaeon]|nr:mechanosensitive ion channel family protein [Candidatus Bathyarchaeota archaeon]
MNSSTIFGATWSQILTVATVALAAFILERVITSYLRRFAKRARLEPNVTNSLVLTFRILILIGAVASIVRVGGLTTEWFVAFSALGGAAVGFASQQTIGNFVAGLYLLA